MSLEKAQALIDEQKLDEALAVIEADLARNANQEAALLLRSKVHTRRSELDAALRDAERAVVIGKGSAKAQLRRAICLWRLKRVGEARALVRYFGTSPEAETWRELLEGTNEKVAEVPRIPDLHAPPRAPHEDAALPRPAPPALQAKRAFRTDWFQTRDTATLILYRKDLDAQQTRVTIEPRRLAVASPGFDWSLALGNAVDAAASRHELTPYKVEFVLKKAEPRTWESLTAAAPATATAAPPSEAPAAEPSEAPAPPSAPGAGGAAAGRPTPAAALTSYSKWEHFEDEDGEKDDDPMVFFQNLYRDATPEVQRAMMKSYIESRGTALSTNWEEVSKGRVEAHPPRDLEMRED